jgi:hypothetical protein
MKTKMQTLRTLVALFLLLTTAFGAKAQKAKDSLMKLVSKEVCEEISAKDLTGKTMDDMQMELSMAFMPVLMRHKDALEKELGVGVISKEGMEKLGQEIGMGLVLECPAFMKVMSASMESGNKPSGKTAPFSDAPESSIGGTLVKLVPGELTHLLLKDTKGKLVKIWWMDHFEGADDMIDQPQRMLNKKVNIRYTEKEVYSAALKQYVKIKIATGIAAD